MGSTRQVILESCSTKYVVFVGRVPGIYQTWTSCYNQTNKFTNTLFKSYNYEEEALEAWQTFTEIQGEIMEEEFVQPDQGRWCK